ncbi:acyl-CoA synthetase [Pseudonocardiaceae bacterium YIM PH 21723]|nr:acyl-CoA synthetase [Pseudonocardiaceae bacterium YIM PH 21723]
MAGLTSEYIDTTGNIADLVSRSALKYSGHPAFIDVTSVTPKWWGSVNQSVDVEASRLQRAGVTPGDRVVVRLPNCSALAIAVFGVLRAGGVVVPMNPQAPAAELDWVLTDSGALHVISDEPVGLPEGVQLLSAPGESSIGDEAPQVSAAQDSGRGGEDLAVLAYTSGISGRPRGVMLSHRALIANVAQCRELVPPPVQAEDRVLLALPLFHSYGLGPGLFQAAAAGATAILVPRFEPQAVVDAMIEHRATTFIGVPTMYQALLSAEPDRLREAFAGVRLATSGAAPLEPPLAAAFREATGLEIFEGYGMTETGPVLTTTLVGGLIKPGSVGRPIPGVQLRLVDADGEPLPDEDEGGTGLVSVRGDNLFLGYWPDAEQGPGADGWLVTSDVGYLDVDGDLHLVDRQGDLIIVNGFNVYPHEVERTLLELPQLDQAAVVGVQDARTGEAVKAVLVPRQGSRLTEDEVAEHCRVRLARFKVPTIVEFADDLPHTATGKINRRALRR